MAENFITRRKELQGIATAWTTNNTVLLEGEWGIETDSIPIKAKLGDGVTAWNDLPYFGGEFIPPTIQEVLTQGNEVTAGTELIFKDVFGTDTKIDQTPNLFKITTNAEVRISSEDNTKQLKYQSNGSGLNSIIDYSPYTTGTPADDRLIYSQRGYVDDVKKETALYSATTTGTVVLDCDTFDSWYRVLTGNTDFQFSNTPPSGESFVKTLEVVGAFSLDFTTADRIEGTYVDDGTTINLITINLANYPTIGLRVTVLIS